MAKRLTDTDKYTDPWFRRLSTKNKVLWDWMLCSCDHAGLISIDLEFIEMVLGEKFEDDIIERHFSERVYKLGPFKYFIPKFIKFQYGTLNPASKIHNSVIKKLAFHGIDYTRFDTLWDFSHTVIVKDKDKDIASSFSSSLKEECVKNEVPKIDEIQNLYDSVTAGKGKLSPCRGLSQKSLQEYITTVSFKEFRNILTWREVFVKTGDSEFLNGTAGNFTASLPWLLIHHNALSVLNGQYSGTPDKQKGVKAAFKSKTNGIAPTPENPTGNPYLQEAIDKGLIA